MVPDDDNDNYNNIDTQILFTNIFLIICSNLFMLMSRYLKDLYIRSLYKEKKNVSIFFLFG